MERGLVHPEHVKSEGTTSSAKEPKDAAALPASVVNELSAHSTSVIQAELAQNPTVALAVTVFTLALPLFGCSSSYSCLQISLKAMNPATIVTVKEDCGGHAAIAAEAALWGDRLPGNPDDLFAWCLEQPQDVLLSLLAFCAASSVNTIKDKFDVETCPRLAHADALVQSLNIDMKAHWTPSVEGFDAQLSKAGLLIAAKEAKATLSIAIRNVKKTEAARHVMKAMAQTGWLPTVLRGKAVTQQGDYSDIAEAA